MHEHEFASNLVCRICGETKELEFDESITFTAQQMKDEIAEDIAAGIVPSVDSFSALHEHVDANDYGRNAYSDDYAEDEDHTVWNAASALVDAWLKAGRA